jgi:hypothetical protein
MRQESRPTTWSWVHDERVTKWQTFNDAGIEQESLPYDDAKTSPFVGRCIWVIEGAGLSVRCRDAPIVADARTARRPIAPSPMKSCQCIKCGRRPGR